jgi:hypothetical protein
MKGKQEDYQGYDEELSKKFGVTIEEMYGEHPVYKERNKGIVEFVLKDKPQAIFEFACTYDFLALEIIRELPDIRYVCTNFLPEVVKYIQDKMSVKSFVFDANEIPHTDLSEFDTFICTSLEHLKNDVEILDSLPEPCTIYFCVTNMPDKTHEWGFDDEWEIYNRYKDVMRITDYKIFKYNTRMKMIGRGIRD